MFHCIVVGDSLAVGVGQYRQNCETVAKVGITSGHYIDALMTRVTPFADSAVISLGVNDDPSAATLRNLRILRAHIRVRRAYWLIPGIKDNIRRSILEVAREYQDYTLDTRGLAGPDHIHPTGTNYRRIAYTTDRADRYFARLGR